MKPPTSHAHAHIHTSIHKHTGLIMLDRPDALNALTYDMCRAIKTTLSDWAEDDQVKQVVMYSDAPRGFCAGGDVRQIREMVLAENTPEETIKAADYFALEYSLNQMIAEYRKPVVVIAHGITMGGGAGLLMNASDRIITDDIVFGMPETRIGHFPDVGASRFLREGTRFGHFLALTGISIDYNDMLAEGLAYSYIKASDKAKVVEAICDYVPGEEEDSVFTSDIHTAYTPFLHEDYKGKLVTNANTTWLYHTLVLPRLSDVRDIAARARNPLGKPLYEALTKNAPLSLHLTHHLFDDRLMMVTDCEADALRLDYILAKQMVALPDFAEGVRAVLVDKDNTPHWQHPNIDEVEYGVVEDMFPSLKYLKEKSDAYH